MGGARPWPVSNQVTQPLISAKSRLLTNVMSSDSQIPLHATLRNTWKAKYCIGVVF